MKSICGTFILYIAVSICGTFNEKHTLHLQPKHETIEAFGKSGGMEQAKPFELFYLEELLAEGIISRELFDVTYEQLTRILEKEEELEL